MRLVVQTIAVLTLVSGCASSPEPVQAQEERYDEMYAREIYSATRRIDDSLRVLAETQNAKTIQQLTADQVAAAERNASYTPPQMHVPLTLDYVGPLQALVQMVGGATNYEVRVMGKAPVPDTLVRVQSFRKPAIDILRNAGSQAGAVADINIFAGPRVIEVRYNADRGAAQLGSLSTD